MSANAPPSGHSGTPTTASLRRAVRRPAVRGEQRNVPKYEGRLELTWTNKHERLLAHEDGSYEWLSPSDYRVAEVRLQNS
jgi:hypothetical protein